MLKYAKMRDQFAAITRANVAQAPPPTDKKFRRMMCDTPTGPGRTCGHYKTGHNGGEFACKTKGCGCRGFHFSGE